MKKDFKQMGKNILKVKGKTIVVKEYDFTEGFGVPFIYISRNPL